jgi:sodium transport system permease protein
MAPGVELTLGNSLIPVTGVVLILRALLEGSYLEALNFLAPVVAVTIACCILAARWAVEQFNSESVLFRESERLDVVLWVRHLYQDRNPTPSAGAAVFCGVAILMMMFFFSFAASEPSGSGDYVVVALVSQLVVIAAPAILMTVLFTTSPRQTLLLGRPRWTAVLAAAVLAVLLHPAVHAARVAIGRLYPLSEEIQDALRIRADMPIVLVFGMFALLPALCEELAFRGFILSGLRHLGHKWRAIIYSALFFGASHMLFQRSILTTLVGLVIGFIAVQAGSILPCMVFHAVHNGVSLALGTLVPAWSEWVDRWPVLGRLIVRADEGGVVFHWPVVVVSSALACALLVWFQRLPYQRSAEEERREAILRALHADG